MEAPIQALRNLGVLFTHVFSSDNDEKVRKTIRANYPPEILYKDITKRDVAKVPSVDLYLAGFPCQPFSNAGKKQGFQDSKNRGTIFFRIREYINKKRPKVFVLENVKGITSLGNGRYLKAIMRSLRAIRSPVGDVRGELTETSCQAYRLEHRILNTKDHGIPQDRPRWYCVGIRKDVEGDSFEFPTPILCPPIDLFLDKTVPKESPKEGTMQKNIKRAAERIRELGHDPQKEIFVIDCDASAKRMHWRKDCSPCITRSRCRGHWISTRERRFTIEEMFRSQGMDPSIFKKVNSATTTGQNSEDIERALHYSTATGTLALY